MSNLKKNINFSNNSFPLSIFFIFKGGYFITVIFNSWFYELYQTTNYFWCSIKK